MSLKAKQFKFLLILLAIILGALGAWDQRHAMNPDGISYLDIGEDFWNGNFGAIVNAHWSPLYPIILGFFVKIFSPPPYWEFATPHAVNFLIYLFALGVFSFLLREIIRYDLSKRGERAFPDWLWMLFGYGLFLITSLNFITLGAVTPDLLVAGFMYLAFGLLFREKFILLGLVLGFAYLSRAPMFLLSPLIIILTLFFRSDSFQVKLKNAAVSLAMFLIVSLPFAAALTLQKGYATFSESGKLNYAWHINKSIPYVGWLYGPNSPRKIFENPDVLAFAEPIHSTYPLWRDPSYWNERVSIHFDISGHISALVQSGHELWFLTKRYLWPAILALLILLFGARGRIELGASWPVLLISFVGIAMYSLVHVASRYVAPFILLGAVGLFLSIPYKRGSITLKFLLGCSAALLFGIILGSNKNEAKSIIDTARFGEKNSIHSEWQVAEELEKAGVKRGSKVGVIGDHFGALGAYFAKLLDAKIVAEIPEGPLDRFWGKDKTTRMAVLKAFKEAGAEVVVAEIVRENAPRAVQEDGWKHVLGTARYYFVLD